MKKYPFYLAFTFLIPVLFFSGTRNDSGSEDLQRENIVACGPTDDADIEVAPGSKNITVMPGWGDYSYAISTKNDSAQFYFNQGLTLYYSYHWREAVLSFKESAKFDSSAAMAYWGQALALGPGYNFTYTYTMRKQVPEALREMNAHGANASAKEKELIAAMNVRYDVNDSTDNRRMELNKAYAVQMKKIAMAYPGDLDLKVLYIDAVMLIHAWDFWHNDGTPKEWTPEVVAMCEEVLKGNKMHPGALHYYIHLTEASRHPEVGLASADVLKDLLPGVAHMVHMSSHEYERNGLYAKGVEVNEKADQNLMLYDSLVKGLSPVPHSPHYFAVQTYCALSGGMYKKGMPIAFRCRNSVTPVYENTYNQYLFMLPEIARVRLGKWQDIINDKVMPDAKWPYALVLFYFAKGMAYAHTGELTIAENYLKQLQEKAQDSVLSKRNIPFNRPVDIASIPENILAATIHFMRKEYDPAVTSLQKAITAEESLIYIEPKDWMMPARQYLGAILLKMNKPADAEKVYREDLVWNPGNGWSLLGLSQSLNAQNKLKEAERLKPLYMHSFSEADEIPPGSVY